jgi:hypothetical protein
VTRPLFGVAVSFGLAIALTAVTAAQQSPAPAKPAAPAAAAPQPGSARANAQVDLTGYWVALITEDWRYRMVTPPKGDFSGLPINSEGRKIADTWDPSKEGSCLAYGAAGVMRMPLRVHITWENDNTLKIETDAGQQTRLLRFTTAAAPPGERSLQGYSTAQWIRSGGGGLFGGFAGFGGGGGGSAKRWTPLKVVTTQLSPGWLRRNGAPYSENTTVTEYFLRLSDEEDEWLTVSTTVEDPKYLLGSVITSSNFKREPDGSKWKPTPCKAS